MANFMWHAYGPEWVLSKLYTYARITVILIIEVETKLY